MTTLHDKDVSRTGRSLLEYLENLSGQRLGIAVFAAHPVATHRWVYGTFSPGFDHELWREWAYAYGKAWPKNRLPAPGSVTALFENETLGVYALGVALENTVQGNIGRTQDFLTALARAIEKRE